MTEYVHVNKVYFGKGVNQRHPTMFFMQCRLLGKLLCMKLMHGFLTGIGSLYVYWLRAYYRLKYGRFPGYFS